MTLATKTVVITGASSGIGAQLARDYEAEGWNVIACGRSLEKLKVVLGASSSFTFLEFDVSDKQEVQRQLQGIDQTPCLWIFNAGSCEYIDNGVLDVDLVKRVFDVNFQGVVNSLAACQSRLRPNDHVAIVSSIAGVVALPRAEAYGASKAAINYFLESLALDWQNKGVTLSTIYPGFVETPLTDKNDFPMPMKVTVQRASSSIRKGLQQRKSKIYFPMRFTWIIRIISILPYSLRNRVLGSIVTTEKV
ncbi:SDR family NAD(P)-dependent oxidoreductase [Vibrio sp. WJH972]